MQIIGLTKENVEYFTKYLTADVAENIGRSFICGIVLVEEAEGSFNATETGNIDAAETLDMDATQTLDTEEPSYADMTPIGAIVWELRQGEGELDVDSRILFVKAKDEEAADILMQEYTELIAQMECGNSSFELPVTLGSVEKNALEKAGFTMEVKEGDVVCVALADLCMALHANDRQDSDVKKLSGAEERDFDNAITRLDDEGKRGTCEDMPYLPMDYFDNEISCYTLDDELINAIVLMHRRPSGKIDVSLAEVLEDGNEKGDIKNLLKQSAFFAEELYEPGEKYLFDCSNPSLKKLTEEILPKAKGQKVVSGFRKEELLPQDGSENEDTENAGLEYDEEYEEEYIEDLI